MVCYEISLLNLVLPNTTLVSGFGGRIAFYPYVYVELENVSASSGRNQGIIYSNNPNAIKALFRAAIKDVPNPVVVQDWKVITAFKAKTGMADYERQGNIYAHLVRKNGYLKIQPMLKFGKRKVIRNLSLRVQLEVSSFIKHWKQLFIL